MAAGIRRGTAGHIMWTFVFTLLEDTVTPYSYATQIRPLQPFAFR